jgi:opacity protein-like surface antigen
MVKKFMLAASLLALITGPAYAEDVTQNCILTGVVNKRIAAQRGFDIYIEFKKVRPASRAASCDLSKGQTLQVEESETTGLEALPHGARVAYQYTVLADNSAQWERLSPSL